MNKSSQVQDTLQFLLMVDTHFKLLKKYFLKIQPWKNSDFSPAPPWSSTGCAVQEQFPEHNYIIY